MSDKKEQENPLISISKSIQNFFLGIKEPNEEHDKKMNEMTEFRKKEIEKLTKKK